MSDSAPKWFLPVAIVALIWNLLGCAAYLFDAMLTAEQIAQMPEAQQALYAARPFWAVGSTAVAVWMGALGCLALVIRKAWALPVFILSLLGIVVQDIYLFGMSEAVAVGGTTVYILQGLVFVVGVGLIWLTVSAKDKGWVQ